LELFLTHRQHPYRGDKVSLHLWATLPWSIYRVG
jgi:hypothetical protein